MVDKIKSFVTKIRVHVSGEGKKQG